MGEEKNVTMSKNVNSPFKSILNICIVANNLRKPFFMSTKKLFCWIDQVDHKLIENIGLLKKEKITCNIFILHTTYILNMYIVQVYI